jgi:tetratricopeptide (TPR) repeat protein
MKKAALFIFILLLSSLLWAQNRYALIIGNANYPRAEDRLPNAINDTNDISTALRGLGFNVELKQNLQRLDMVREISAFITRLRSDRNSEGFFWYAGHAMEIEGINLLLPLDVNVENDELIRATSYSVTDLTRQLGEVRNKVNVVVLDACRVPPSAGGSRGIGDTSRVIQTVPLTPPDLLVIYSTAPGTVALDGAGRNSPFASAFLSNIRVPEPLIMIAGYVTTDTLNLTDQRQRPYTTGSMGRENIYYSLNPGVSPAPSSNMDAAVAHFNRGMAFEEAGKYDDAIREFTEAVRLYPNYAEAYYNRGSIYFILRLDTNRAIADLTDRAIADFSEVIRLNPNHSAAYGFRGSLYLDNHNYDRAIGDFTEAIRIGHLSEEAMLNYLGRGEAYFNIRSYDNAIADFTEVIRIDSSFAYAYYWRGTAYQSKGDRARANADFARARELGYEE